ILKTISLTVPSGTVMALFGPSGSGKTALLRAIAGLDRAQTGAIRIGDRVVFDPARRIDLEARERKVGLMFQSNALWERRSAFDNVAYCVNGAEGDKGHAIARVSKLLGELGLSAIADRAPSQLSAAERTRLALARALAGEPAVLLLDEPLAQLEPWRRD